MFLFYIKKIQDKDCNILVYQNMCNAKTFVFFCMFLDNIIH